MEKDKTKRARIRDFESLAAYLASDEVKLPRRLRQVARFVLNHPEDVAIHSIVELSRMADVPVSTMTRFSKELGFSGFSELQAVFRQRLLGPHRDSLDRLRGLEKNERPADADGLDIDDPIGVFETFVQSGIDTLLRLQDEVDRQVLTRFVERIAAARTIYILSGRGAFGVGAYCYYGFTLTGKHAILVDNIGAMRAEQLKFAGQEDVCLAISFDSYTRETIEAARDSAELGLDVLAITDNEMSPVASVAIAALYVREARLGHFRSQIPTMALCQSIMVSVGRRLSSQQESD